MSMTSVEDRIRRYTERLIPDRVKEDFATQKPVMVAKVTEIFNLLVTIEDRVKGILSGEAVITVDYPKYHAFSKEIFKLQRRFGGGSGLNEEVALLVAKWKARGCLEPVLNKIRDEVFSIPAPGAP